MFQNAQNAALLNWFESVSLLLPGTSIYRSRYTHNLGSVVLNYIRLFVSFSLLQCYSPESRIVFFSTRYNYMYSELLIFTFVLPWKWYLWSSNEIVMSVFTFYNPEMIIQIFLKWTFSNTLRRDTQTDKLTDRHYNNLISGRYFIF